MGKNMYSFGKYTVKYHQGLKVPNSNCNAMAVSG